MKNRHGTNVKTVDAQAISRVVHERRTLNLSFALLFALVGSLLSIAQPLGEGPDYFSYSNFFDSVRSEGYVDAVVDSSRFEIGFTAISILLVNLIASNSLVNGVFVFFAMLVKGRALNKLSFNYMALFVLAVFYFVRYFPLHELAQLRTACATSIILAGALIFWSGSKRVGLLTILLAGLFHYSSIAIVPAIFFAHYANRFRLFARYQLLLVGILSFIFIGYFSKLITNYLANYLDIILVYQEFGFGDVTANPLGVHLLIDWFCIFISLFIWNSLSLLMRQIILIQVVGMAIFYGAIEYPVVAFRLREIYSILWLVYIAEGVRYQGARILSLAFFSASIIWYAYIYFFRGNFFLS